VQTFGQDDKVINQSTNHTFGQCTPNIKPPNRSPTSTRHNSTSMEAIDEALAAIELQEFRKKLMY
jgi:hypothetical protein